MHYLGLWICVMTLVTAQLVRRGQSLLLDGDAPPA